MGKRTAKKTPPPDAEEHEAEAIDREMDAAAGPMGEEDEETADTEEDEEEEAESPEPEAKAAPTAEEEALAERVLASLRASDKPLTVTALHAEIGEGGPNGGQDGYIASGQVEKAVLLLVDRGVAMREGEAFLAVPPAVLAKRRARLLADATTDGELGVDGEQEADARALAHAGLAQVFDSVESSDEGLALFVNDDQEAEILRRGALVLVCETMADCREAAPVGVMIVDGNPGVEIAKLRRQVSGVEALYEGAIRQRAEGQQALEKVRANVETLREWFAKNNLAWPLDKPEVPKPPRQDFTHTITVDLTVKGRMYGIRKKIAARLDDATAALNQAKADFKTAESAATIKIKALDDAEAGLFYDVNVYREVDVQAGVARLRAVEDESWVVEEVALRSEQIAAERAKAEAPPAAPEAAPAAPDGAMPIVPADQHGALQAAVASPAFAAKLAEATGQPVSVDTSGAVPVVTVGGEPARPKRDLVLDKKHVEEAVVELVGTFRPDEATTTREATDALAKLYSIADVQALGLLVKAAAKSAHKKGLIRWELVGGDEVIARLPEKKPEAPTATEPAKDPVERALAMVRAAGPEGIRRTDVLGAIDDDTINVIETLLERGAIKANGKRGVAARVIAAEHLPTNGAAEVSP